MSRTVVVGAGLSGLACAHTLRRAGREVLLLEASDRPGGVTRTVEDRGFFFETGPNTIPAGSRSFRELVTALGLDSRLVAADDSSKQRMLFHRGRLVALPSGPLGFLTTPLLSPGAKLRVLSEPFRKWRPPSDDETEPGLDEFLADRLGTEAMRTLAGAFVRGVHGGEIDRLGARSAFPRLWDLARNHGGLARGAWRLRSQRSSSPSDDAFRRSRLISFPRGLQEVVDALEQELGDSLVANAPAAALEQRGSSWEVRTAAGDRVHGEDVVLAVGAPAAARLIRGLDPASPAHDLLTRVEHASITLVQLGFDPGGLELPRAFGFLVPPDEARREGAPKALGVLFSSRIFAGRTPPGAASVTCIYRADHLGSAEPLETALGDLRIALGLDRDPEPSVRRVLEWGPVLPQYTVGHAERMGELAGRLRQSRPRLHLAGNYMAGVSVEHVIQRGRSVAQRILSAMEVPA